MDDIAKQYLQIPVDDVMLFHDYTWDFYDGPLTGLCLLRGTKHYYHCFAWDIDGPYFRRFALHTLTPEQEAEEEYWEEEYWRTHRQPGDSRIDTHRTREEHYEADIQKRMKYYEANNPIVGWFEDTREEPCGWDCSS
jgi:hypothetical protein